MTVYSVEKLIAQARKLAADYRKATGKALPGISNELAEHDAARLLGLELLQERGQGYDALGRGRWEGQRIQIKGRTIFDESKQGQRIGQLRLDQPWDCVILVLMDEEYSPYEIYEAKRADIESFLNETSANRRKRGAMSVARFKIIGRLAWTVENGLEEELWSNSGG